MTDKKVNTVSKNGGGSGGTSNWGGDPPSAVRREKETVEKLEGLGKHMVKQVKQGTSPTFETPLRSKGNIRGNFSMLPRQKPLCRQLLLQTKPKNSCLRTSIPASGVFITS